MSGRYHFQSNARINRLDRLAKMKNKIALSRDRDYAAGFLRRHATKLLWASDCGCRDGAGDHGEFGQRTCWAARMLPLLRERTTPEAFELITSTNARRLLRMPVPA